MVTTNEMTTILQNWTTLLGSEPLAEPEYTGREIWPITAEGGGRYFLKRVGPWRNLPMADQARVLRWLAQQGIAVAEFMITEHATLFAGRPEDSFVLIPHIDADQPEPAAVLGMEETVGHAIARLHGALLSYPFSANSYTERLADALLGELLLPTDVAEAFVGRREAMAAAIGRLPTQLVHGDLTPENVLLRRTGDVAGFIDFDHLPLAPRIWDIAKYLSRRIRLRWLRGAAHAPGRLDYIGGLLRGYHRASPLNGAELEALPAGIAAGNIIEASYNQRIASGLLERRKLRDHDEVLADSIEAARWHLNNYTAVKEAIHAAAT